MTKMITRKGKVDIALSLFGINKCPSSKTHAEQRKRQKFSSTCLKTAVRRGFAGNSGSGIED